MKIQNRPNSPLKQRLVSQLRTVPNINDNRDRIVSFRKMTTGVDGDHLAWDIIIPKLDFQSQMNISQLNQHLADVVESNAEHELGKFRRHIAADKYMLVNINF